MYPSITMCQLILSNWKRRTLAVRNGFLVTVDVMESFSCGDRQFTSLQNSWVRGWGNSISFDSSEVKDIYLVYVFLESEQIHWLEFWMDCGWHVCPLLWYICDRQKFFFILYVKILCCMKHTMELTGIFYRILKVF